MRGKLTLLSICVAIVFSCNEKEVVVPPEKEESIFAVWKRQKIEKTYLSDEAEANARKKPDSVVKDFYVNIFPDGRGSIIYKTEIDTFLWQIAKNNISEDTIRSITANLPIGRSEIELLFVDGGTTMELTTDNGNTKMHFIRQSNLATNFEEDSSYPDNNYWRIRKLDLLSEAEIGKKVDNYLQHYLYLFKAAIDEDNPIKFSNQNSKGILKVFKSSIGIANKHEIDEDWYSYFYNEEEAEKAYDLLKSKIKKSNVEIEKSDNWLQDNYLILEDMMDG